MDTHKSQTRIVYPHGRARLLHGLPGGGPLSLALIPGSILYKWGSGFVKSARIGRRQGGHGCTIVSVGNIEVGGNGKTPMAMDLVNRLSAGGHRPVYVSRGFKSEAERSREVTVMVPERWGSPLAIPAGVRALGIDPGSAITPKIGDEGAVVMMRCPAVPMVFCRDRARAVGVAREMFAPTHIILDDAFQTWSVARDVDIVLLDARSPLGNGRIIPAGTLREGPEALQRAHTVGFNNIGSGRGAGGRSSDAADDLSEMGRWAARHAGWAVPVFGIQRSLTFIDTGSRRAEKTIDGAVAAMCAIGRPDRFESSLRDCAIDLPLSIRFPDHHRFDSQDVRRVESLLAKKGIDKLVVTEKDWVKLREVGPPSANIWVSRLDLDVIGKDPLTLCEKPQAVPAAFL